MPRATNTVFTVSAAFAAAALALAFQDAPAPDPASQEATPNTVRYDRSVWVELLREHKSLLRRVTHTENGIRAVTESLDPALVPMLIDHAESRR